MQQSWRQDPDKLTFIVCAPVHRSNATSIGENDDGPDNMLGDVNLFLRMEDEEGEGRGSSSIIVGEIELMIAEKKSHRMGYGRAALLSLLKYITNHEGRILSEFVNDDATHPTTTPPLKLSHLSAKIDQGNFKSLALFGSASFKPVSNEPNYFGELELRREDVSSGWVDGLLERAGIEGYIEMGYRRPVQ